MLWNLALKDIEQNRKALAVTFATAFALPILFHAALAQSGGGGSYPSFAIGYAVISVPILIVHLFIGHEKLKGTFRLLRLLPVSGSRLILTKSVVAIFLCLVVANLMMFVEPLVLRSVGINYALPGALSLLWINLATAFICALAAVAFVVFEHKIALQVSYLMIFGLMLGFAALEKGLAQTGLRFSLAERAAQTYLLYWGGPVVLLLIAAFILFAGRLFEAKEWPELEEN